MAIFSALALYLTTLWNKGFQIGNEPIMIVKSIIVIAILFYLIVPITKLVLLPLNILTMGLVGVIVYFFLFYFIVSRWPLIIIKGWIFPGLTIAGLTVHKTIISYFFNVILSALSISIVINFLEALI